MKKLSRNRINNKSELLIRKEDRLLRFIKAMKMMISYSRTLRMLSVLKNRRKNMDFHQRMIKMMIEIPIKLLLIISVI